jgi:hypothetical protein
MKRDFRTDELANMVFPSVVTRTERPNRVTFTFWDRKQTKGIIHCRVRVFCVSRRVELAKKKKKKLPTVRRNFQPPPLRSKKPPVPIFCHCHPIARCQRAEFYRRCGETSRYISVISTLSNCFEVVTNYRRFGETFCLFLQSQRNVGGLVDPKRGSKFLIFVSNFYHFDTVRCEDSRLYRTYGQSQNPQVLSQSNHATSRPDSSYSTGFHPYFTGDMRTSVREQNISNDAIRN